MNNLRLPELKIQYFYLQVFHVQHPEDLDGSNFKVVIAPDSYIALAVFCSLYPHLSSTGLVRVSDCVSVFPQNISL